ncbi:uncharacterized protein FFFS_03006 [Fusarium fujikuroi]|nr:uncharacterized protein FFFS_03006 [Fusarium fujikuroi]
MGFDPEFHIAAEDISSEGGVPEVRRRIQKLQELRDKLATHWRNATERQAKYFNSKHQEMNFKQGQLVMLSTKNLKLKGEKKKLAPRFIGPFRITKRIGLQAYRLALPNQYARIHNVFHVSLLEAYQARNREDNDSLPMPDLEEEDDQWEVERIKDEKEIYKELHYLVKWKGWPAEYDQWVAAADMENAPRVIATWEKSQAKQKGKRLKSQAGTTPRKRGRPRKEL